MWIKVMWSMGLSTVKLIFLVEFIGFKSVFLCLMVETQPGH